MDESVQSYLRSRESGVRLKMSEAIRIGAAMVPEDHRSYCGCALGTAYRGLTGRNLQDDTKELSPFAVAGFVAKAFGMPVEIAAQAEYKHLYSGGAHPRAEIADWLEAQGY